jgi:hypothetical protein
MIKKPEVGQVIYFVPAENSGGGKPRNLTVTKVGRKYFECGKFTRFWVDTWREESHFTFGRAYLSEAHYEEKERFEQTWLALRREISAYGVLPPENLTLIDMHAFANRCGFVLEVKIEP